MSRNATAEAAERLKQVQGLADEVGRSAVVKNELLQELARVQGRQRDVAGQLDASEDQLKRLEAALKNLGQRRTQLAFSEKRIATFEARAGELAQLTEEIDAKIAALGKKHAIVDAVSSQVASIHEVSARSKSDLEYVEAHRNEVAALRERVDEVLSMVTETETRLVSIQSRKQLVEEVQLKTNVITNMLEDVRLNVETLGEQKAVVDHVMDNFTRLTEKVQEAQTTLRALQTERELAERIERGVKNLRKTAAPDEKKRA
jgi:chromosome segregation ATPase